MAVRGRTPNVSALKEEVSNHGRVVVGKAYADWVTRAPELKGASQFIQDPPSLYAAGIEPVYVPTRLPPGGSYGSGRTIAVKNSVDVKMTADCIDTAHNFPNINTFVLVSGDSDFIHVINSLRAVGKRVVVVGVSWATSRRMADHVDGLIFYDADVDPIDVEPAPHRGPYQRNRQPAPAQLSNPGRHQLPEVIRAIEDVIRTERAAGHTLLLTSLKQRLVRRIAGFDERKLGFSGFKKLMLRVAEEGNIKIRSVDLVDWILMADEPDPVPQNRVEDDQREEFDEQTAAQADDWEAQDNGANWGAEAEYITDSFESESATDAPDGPAPEESRVEVAEPPGRPALVRPRSPDYEALLSEAIGELDLPESDDTTGDVSRIADLIAMGYTLEERDGPDHVMFNALCSEISEALAAGIEAEDGHIVSGWGENNSRAYVIRLIRNLASNEVFHYRNVSVRDPETNRMRRRRVFGLNRESPVVGAAVALRLGLPYESAAPVEVGINDALATPALDEHGSAEAAHAESADDAEAAVVFS